MSTFDVEPPDRRASLLPVDAGTEAPPAAPVEVEEELTRPLPLKRPRAAAPPIPPADGKLIAAAISVAIMLGLFLLVLAGVAWFVWTRYFAGP